MGHVVRVDTFARGLGPACEATDTILYILLAQIHDFDLCADIPHTSDKMIEHQFGFALASTPGAGVKCKYSHFISFNILID